MPDLLLELYVEEIPALMQKNAATGYAEIFANSFELACVTYSNLETDIGPRRIMLHVTNMEAIIPAKVVEYKGPKVSAPESAIQGFCTSHNINKEDLIVRVIKDQECYVYEKSIAEQNVTSILPEILNHAISEYVWPKSMYWGDVETKFVRPIRNILCLFDGAVLHLTYEHLKSNNKTFGHRFMHYHELEIGSFEQYCKLLEQNMVILSRTKRMQIIQDSINDLIGLDFTISNDSKLLEEVAGIVEYPNVLMGKIPKKFMHVPNEVLITAMRNHQRYFTLQYADGGFAPYFIFVSNILTDDQNDIISGNEKVLSARLSDAEYFYRQDQKTTLESRITQLERITFHTKLGNMKDKVQRVEQITKWLAPNNRELHFAARLCKSDLVTEVVGEFPELQGIMGGCYAKLEGLSDVVANAIKYHYNPEGIDDALPQGEAALLALADKIDSLTSLYIAGERSSGSKDPYALRRYALGIIRIILDMGMQIDLRNLLSFATSLHINADNSAVKEILLFIEDRLKHYMLKNYKHDIVNATINLMIDSDIVTATNKLTALNSFLQKPEGQNALTSYRRVNNILSSNGNIITDKPDHNLFVTKEERALFQQIQNISSQIDIMIQEKQLDAALQLLASLHSIVNQFFDNVTVMDKSEEISYNRLALLQMTINEFHKLAMMSCLE